MTPRRPVPPAVGFAIGVALLLAAGWAIRAHAAPFAAAWASFRDAGPGLWILAAVLPLANWLLSAEVFVTLTARVRRVPRSDMIALTGSAWLLNYLPLRPGLVGRVAFHKAVHGIAVRDSARAVVESIVLGSIAAAALGLAALGKPLAGPMPILALGFLAPCLIMAAKFGGDSPGSARARTIITVLGLKILDTLVWAARYILAFHLMGRPIDLPAAVAFSVVSQAATLIPLAGNGLGLREWAVGLLAAALPAETGTSTIAPGLSADVLNRLVEVAVAIPVGVTSSLWIARRFRNHASTLQPPAEDRL